MRVCMWKCVANQSCSGEQVGYGDEFPKGLAYYRQSLLQATTDSKLSGYGMMELIIEDN